MLCGRLPLHQSWTRRLSLRTKEMKKLMKKSKDATKLTTLDPQTLIRTSESGQQWIADVGLEVHAQIDSVSKLFSSALAREGVSRPANMCVDLFDASIPGTLPTLNAKCVEMAVSTAIALEAQVQPVSHFDRKHYFYADMPAGYQITQQRSPLARQGVLRFPVRQSDSQFYMKQVDLVQLQLEQDSGKSLHDVREGESLIDLNRCGVGLMELVFAPQLRSGLEASEMIRELRLILIALKSCTGDMESGALRVDVNVSVRPIDSEVMGVRTETKNINSMSNVKTAIESEVERQIQVLEDNAEVENETRAFDAINKCTMPMRDKEVRQDYRFMPEPNLPPLRLSEQSTSGREMREKQPLLPAQLRAELMDKGLTIGMADKLMNVPHIHTFFIKCLNDQTQVVEDVRQLFHLLLLRVDHTVRQVSESGDVNATSLTPSMMVEVANAKTRGELGLKFINKWIEMLVKDGHQWPTARAALESTGWLESSRDVVAIRSSVSSFLSEDGWRSAKRPKMSEKRLMSLMMKELRSRWADKFDMVYVEKVLKEEVQRRSST